MAERSKEWLAQYKVDAGASQVFLSLQPEQQEALRRLGGLGKNNPSGILMRRIRSWFGYVDIQTCIASEPTSRHCARELCRRSWQQQQRRCDARAQPRLRGDEKAQQGRRGDGRAQPGLGDGGRSRKGPSRPWVLGRPKAKGPWAM